VFTGLRRPIFSPGTPKGSWGYDLRMATTVEPRVFATIDESAVSFGLTVTEQVPVEVPPRASNRRYLETKRAKLGHRLHYQDLRFESDEL
jgi:hypothetical protein